MHQDGPYTLYTIGYGRWPAPQRVHRMIQALQVAAVSTLVDIRHSRCSANTDPRSNYGPKEWNLQMDRRGIAHHLAQTGLAYLWLVELGNPQKKDPAMAPRQGEITCLRTTLQQFRRRKLP